MIPADVAKSLTVRFKVLAGKFQQLILDQKSPDPLCVLKRDESRLVDSGGEAITRSCETAAMHGRTVANDPIIWGRLNWKAA